MLVFGSAEMVLREIILIIPWSKGGGDEIISIFFAYSYK